MAKRKKKRNSKRYQSRSNLTASWLEGQISIVQEVYDEGEYEEAFELLLILVEQFPHEPAVLTALVDTAIQIKNMRAIATYGEKLYPMEVGDDRCTTLNYLIKAYIDLGLPALAWDTAHILLENRPNPELRAYVNELIPKIEEGLLGAFTQIDLLSQVFNEDEDKILNFIAEHDRMRFFAENGQSRQAIKVCRYLLKQVPGFTPALNNMSLAYFMQGKIKEATDLAQQVLAKKPKNVHALSNLARYSFLSGDIDAVSEYAETLNTLDIDSPDQLLKQIEVLAYLGDDEGIIAYYLDGHEYDSPNASLLLHLTAAATYRIGSELEALSLWEKALEIDPSFDIAYVCLADFDKEPHKRNIGWYWPLKYWFTSDLHDTFDKILSKRENSRAMKKIAQKFLKQCPQFPILAPHILDRGDSDAREVLFALIQATERIDCAKALLTFGLSEQGTDAQRFECLQFVCKAYPELLPENRRVVMWYRSKQEEVLLVPFHVYREAKETILDDATHNMYAEACADLEREQNLDEAEQIFMEVAKAYPDFPAVFNQIGLIYEIQGNVEDARTLIEKTHARFPDYTFARMGLARMYLKEGRPKKARALLNPVLEQTDLHITELRALAQAEIIFALVMKDKKSAHIWLNVWERFDEHNSDIATWRNRIKGKKPSMMRKLLRRLGL